MSSHAYSEDQLVEQPAVGLFSELGWRVASSRPFTAPLALGAEVWLDGSGLFGRETKSEVVLVDRLRAALLRLNPGQALETLDMAIDEITRDRAAMSLEAANREVYRLLKDGVSVAVPNVREGGEESVRLRVIDWARPDGNDFLLVSQFSVVGALYTCRPDLVGFVNGLPWVVIEMKRPGMAARSGFEENLTHYKREIPQLFWYSALLIASNGTESRVGSLTADWERFFEWKRVEREDEPRRVSLEVMLRGTCDRGRLLDMVENFTLFSEHKGGVVKVIAQNHQFLGVNNAIASMQQARALGHGRAGVFWQTQGSGKSFSMVFFAQKVLRKLAGNWTFVIVTDRAELDDQIAKTFKNAGAVSAAEAEQCHATSGAHLRELLRGNHRYVFTLIHKFQTCELLTNRPDVIVLTDEAHRSQYDTLALNMRTALPRAMFLAFTGTPLIVGEELTRDVFGDYVSIYDFQQSVEDGATLPLFYENRTPELELVNPNLNDDIYQLIDDAGLEADEEARLEAILGRQYHLITRDDRLESIAADIVRHFLGRGFVGKAMVVSIDKATALKMYNKVKSHWQVECDRVAEAVGLYDAASPVKSELEARLEVLNTTDMALVVSPGQNEIEQMRRLGLDIEPHRRLMNESQPGLDERFKDTDDPLRLVFVCAMWLTGFDAPSCSTIYLDKPMRNHTLMQTIARANRVFPGKHSGVIVDYANVFASLEKALAIYGPGGGGGGGGGGPVKGKEELVRQLREAIRAASEFCAAHGVSLEAMEKMALGSMERLSAIELAVEALVSPEDVRREFLGHERLVGILYRAVKPDPVVTEFSQRVAAIATLAEAIRAKTTPPPPDTTPILEQIARLLDNSIAGHTIREGNLPPLDLSKINFQALVERFKEAKHKKSTLEALRAAIKAKLDMMVQFNRTRVDFADKFAELIESYNNGSRAIEQVYEDLLNLSRRLDDEQSRHIRENLKEEELVVFDILTRPAPELTTAERDEVKKVACVLLRRIKTLLAVNWRQKAASRSRIRLAIADELDGLPKRYSKTLYEEKCANLFEHIYERYPERERGIYVATG